jgi:hypothetical protein
MQRACVHCVLARAVRAESAACTASGVTLVIGHCDPVWLPTPGPRLYRSLRRLVSEALLLTGRERVTLSVWGAWGKSFVDVTAILQRDRQVRLLRRSFPRHVPGTLESGFVEGAF